MAVEPYRSTGMEDPSGLRLMLRPDSLPRRELSLPEVLSHYSRVNAIVAVSARLTIDSKHASGPIFGDDVKAFGVSLDRMATASMERLLHNLPFASKIVGCEGEKENRKDRESGNGSADLPVLTGTYGIGHAIPFSERHTLNLLDSLPKAELVIDPIEGTTRASLNQEGAVAIIAGTLTGRIASIPSEDSTAIYADRIVATPRLKGKVSLDRSAYENVRAVMEEFGLTNPADVEIVVLGGKTRVRNHKLIDALQKAGATLRLISSGDLMPAIEALTQNKPILSMGSGGKEEAVIAACAAKSLGGVFEMRYVAEDGAPAEGFAGLLTLDDVASGNAADYFVNFASITGVPELGLSTPEAIESSYIVPVATITSESAGLVVEGVIV